MAETNEDSAFKWIIQKLVWLILVLTIVSTAFLAAAPLLPTAREYDGTFPDKLSENVEKLPATIFRHFILFNEYYNIEWILYFLSHIFFLLLLFNVRKVIREPLKPKKLTEHYFRWAVGSLLITIVFIAKFITSINIVQISLGILGLTLAIFILLYCKTIKGEQKAI